METKRCYWLDAYAVQVGLVCVVIGHRTRNLYLLCSNLDSTLQARGSQSLLSFPGRRIGAVFDCG